jgi:two-component system, NarL family, sensor histidine kinase UhpB
MLKTIRTWGITARLIALATIPSAIMFLLVNGWLYESGGRQLASQIQERGELIAHALAETSQYGVVSGNLDYIERNIRHLVNDDPNIAKIEVFGADQHRLVSGSNGKSAPDAPRFEAAIRAEVPEIGAFDRADAPHAALPDATASFRAGTPSGFVRVTMSPGPLLARQRERLYLGTLVALLATLISVGGGLLIARGLSKPLRAVMGALRDVCRGNFAVALRPHAQGELGELQTAIERMAEELDRTHQYLEHEVAQRTEELRCAMGELHRGNDEKRRLIARSNTLLEEERRRIAGDLHDHLNAWLLGLGLQAQHIAATARQDDSAAAREEIERVAAKMYSTIQELYRAARSLVKQLRPEVIDTLGLRGALDEMCRSYDELHPGCRFSVVVVEFPELEGDLAMTVYRLIQEALSNIVKYAQASEVVVRLAREADQIAISIADNGIGFDPFETTSEGIGLIGMRERVAALGGTMAIRSAQNAGTTIDIAFTLNCVTGMQQAGVADQAMEKA